MNNEKGQGATTEQLLLERKLTFELIELIDNPDRPENNQDVITMIQNWYLQETDERVKLHKLRTIIGLMGSQYDRVVDLSKIIGKTAFPVGRPYNYDEKALIPGCGYTEEERILVINFYEILTTRIQQEAPTSYIKMVEILEQAILENPETNARLVAFAMVNIQDSALQRLAIVQRELSAIMQDNVNRSIDHQIEVKTKDDDNEVN
jgi:hypothetical protein